MRIFLATLLFMRADAANDGSIDIHKSAVSVTLKGVISAIEITRRGTKSNADGRGGKNFLAISRYRRFDDSLNQRWWVAAEGNEREGKGNEEHCSSPLRALLFSFAPRRDEEGTRACRSRRL